MELTAVSERLGHRSPYATAAVYSHVVKGRDREAARKWEEFQRPAPVLKMGLPAGK
jgi:integrase